MFKKPGLELSFPATGQTLPNPCYPLHLRYYSMVQGFLSIFISINSTSQRHACVRINHPRAIVVGTFSVLTVIIALVTVSIVKSYCTMALVLHPLVLIHWLGVHGGDCVGHGGLLEVGGGSRGKGVSWFRLDWDNFLYIILFFLIAWAGSRDLGYRGGTRALWRRHWVTFRGLSWSVNIFRGL